MTLRWRLATVTLGLTTALNAQVQSPLHIPSDIGAIVRTSDALETRIPDYVLIQDVHSHGEAQTHIAAVLQLAQTQWGVRKAYIEGAFTKVDRNRLPAAFMDKTTWELLTENGQISGPELALLKSAGSFELIGIDDPTLYRENLRVYEELRRWRDQILQMRIVFSSIEKNLFDHLLSLRMTPAEYASYQDYNSAELLPKHWSQAIRMADYFYKLANQRSHAFLANTNATPDTGPRVLVTGGFHTAAMCDELTQEGKSFIVIRPKVTRGGYADAYASKLEESARLLEAPAVVALASR